MERPPIPRQPAGRAAFVVAFLAIVIGGLAGALIGYGVVDVGCTDTERDTTAPTVLVPAPPTTAPTTIPPLTPATGEVKTTRSHGCRVASAVGAVVGGVVGAGGTGIVAVLVLRAMAEWERNKVRLALEDERDGQGGGDGDGATDGPGSGRPPPRPSP
jgi:hypothetical protein